MPSTSKKQARTMAAAAQNPAFAKKVGIPTTVAKDFNRADVAKKTHHNGSALIHPKINHSSGHAARGSRITRGGKSGR